MEAHLHLKNIYIIATLFIATDCKILLIVILYLAVATLLQLYLTTVTYLICVTFSCNRSFISHYCDHLS